MSQSAVTRRVKKLETALGSVLFERTTRAVKPTLAAKRLQLRAEAILEDARETARAMRDETVQFDHQRNAIVSVAIVPTLITPVLAPAVAAFEAAGHCARLRILDGSANEVANSVAEGEADFGLCSIPLMDRSSHFEPILEDPLGVAFPIGHTLELDRELSWKNLRARRIIVPAKGTGNRLLIDEAMAKARLSLEWSFEVARTTSALDLAAQGLGIALVPRSVSANAEQKGLTFRTLSAPSISRPVGFVTRTAEVRPGAASELMSALRKVAIARRTRPD